MISRCCFVEYSKEMHRNACPTCSTIIFPFSPILFLLCGAVVAVAVFVAKTTLWNQSDSKTSSFKPGFHIIVRMVLIAPVDSNNVRRRSGRLYRNTTETIAIDQGEWDDLDRPDRTQFYPSDRGRLSRPRVDCDRLGSVSI